MAPNGAPPETREEALAYIFEMTSALRELADGHKLQFLAYLLEMAAMEAMGSRRNKPR